MMLDPKLIELTKGKGFINRYIELYHYAQGKIEAEFRVLSIGQELLYGNVSVGDEIGVKYNEELKRLKIQIEQNGGNPAEYSPFVAFHFHPTMGDLLDKPYPSLEDLILLSVFRKDVFRDGTVNPNRESPYLLIGHIWNDGIATVFSVREKTLRPVLDISWEKHGAMPPQEFLDKVSINMSFLNKIIGFSSNERERYMSLLTWAWNSTSMYAVEYSLLDKECCLIQQD